MHHPKTAVNTQSRSRLLYSIACFQFESNYGVAVYNGVGWVGWVLSNVEWEQ